MEQVIFYAYHETLSKKEEVAYYFGSDQDI